MIVSQNPAGLPARGHGRRAVSRGDIHPFRRPVILVAAGGPDPEPVAFARPAG